MRSYMLPCEKKKYHMNSVFQMEGITGRTGALHLSLYWNTFLCLFISLKNQKKSFVFNLNFQIMITGVHTIIYSKDSEADRNFFRDIIKLTNVDVGHGWLIFGLPPSELAVHT